VVSRVKRNIPKPDAMKKKSVLILKKEKRSLSGNPYTGLSSN